MMMMMMMMMITIIINFLLITMGAENCEQLLEKEKGASAKHL
jgi:hypothetical protein